MAAWCMPGFAGFDCSIIYLIWIISFFVAAILRKQINENLGTPFSLIGSTAGGIILMIVCLYLPFIGGIKFSVLGAMIGIVAGGFGGGLVGLPDTESE